MSTDAGAALTSGTVKLPGVGPVKKVYLYVGVGAVGVLAAYLMWRRQQAAADVTPADASLGEGLTTGAGSDVYGGATAGGAPTADPDITPMPTTNVEWTQQVLDYFNWLEPGFVSSTIGKYLARVPLSADEADFIRQAWAARSKPPEGPDNFTLSPGTNTPGTTTHPAVPTGLKTTTVTGNTIGLDWADAADATSYQVFRGSSQVGSPTSSAYTDSGLASGTSYTYTVKAVNGANVSAASTAVTAKTTTAAAGKVGAISGRHTTATKTTISASWTAAKNATSYVIFLDGKTYKTVTETKFTIAALKPNSHHTIGIQPQGANGAKGPISNTTLYTKK